jgi:hypothetical protein
VEEEEEKSQDPAITFELEGKQYILKMKDFRGSDDRKLRDVIGMSVVQAWREALNNSAMDALAGLLWLVESRAHPKLRFATVLDKISMYDMETIRDYTEEDRAKDELAQMRADFEGHDIDKAVDANPERLGANS